jgi:hypothetical protein
MKIKVDVKDLSEISAIPFIYSIHSKLNIIEKECRSTLLFMLAFSISLVLEHRILLVFHDHQDNLIQLRMQYLLQLHLIVQLV